MGGETQPAQSSVACDLPRPLGQLPAFVGVVHGAMEGMQLLFAASCLCPPVCCVLLCSFDDVFDETVDNDQVYTQAIQPLITTVFK